MKIDDEKAHMYKKMIENDVTWHDMEHDMKSPIVQRRARNDL